MSTAGNGIADLSSGSIPLGVVSFDRSTVRQPLVGPDDQSGRAEAFRTLRTNLQFTNVDQPPRGVVVTDYVVIDAPPLLPVSTELRPPLEAHRLRRLRLPLVDGAHPAAAVL